MSLYEGSIDDNDPQIIYSDGWELVTSDGDWRGTMHSTSNIGASARVRFTGTRIAFICTIPTGDGQPSQATFAVDGGAPVRVAHATTPPLQWQTTFWDSGPLPYGSHLVTMANAGSDAYLRLDRVDYDPTAGNAPQSPSQVTGTTMGPGGTAAAMVRSTVTSVVVVPASSDVVSSSLPVAGVGSQLSQLSSISLTSSDSAPLTGNQAAPTNSNTSPSSSAGAKLNDSDSGSSLDAQKASSAAPPVAAIVGGVLGALLAIALIVLVLLLYRRKKSRSAMSVYVDEAANANHGGGAGAQGLSVGSRWRGTESTVPTPFSIGPGSSSNLVLHTNATPPGVSPTGESSNSSNASPSSPFSDARGVVSASMYHPQAASESSSAHGSYDTHMYQPNRTAGSSAGASPFSKHAEFVAEQQQRYNQRQQQQQIQQIDPRAVVLGRSVGVAFNGTALSLSLSHHQHYESDGAPSSAGPFVDEAPPPAYPGSVVRDQSDGGVEASMSGWRS